MRKQFRDERREQRRALGHRGHDDELPFAVGMVADGPEPVQRRHAERGDVIAVGTAPDGRLASGGSPSSAASRFARSNSSADERRSSGGT